ncbi:MAG: DUF5615 family PIN-like protein [Elainellaceae cyanobacterium]
MKFLLDVNASGILEAWLIEMGHDVLSVNRLDPRMKDEDILELALEEQRIILTTESDFERRNAATTNDYSTKSLRPSASNEMSSRVAIDDHKSDTICNKLQRLRIFCTKVMIIHSPQGHILAKCQVVTLVLNGLISPGTPQLAVIS